MAKKASHFPFPNRNSSFKNHQIFYDDSMKSDLKYINFCYDKNTSTDSISIANQFFSIEDILLEAFKYVLPIDGNGQTCSVKFATVIRESCNLFEIICRKAYLQFFDMNEKQKIDIRNFLSLEIYLDLTKLELRSPILECYHKSGKKILPFESLNSWNKKEEIHASNIPKWWTAYNKIKHDIDSLCNHATLENSIYSLAALFLLIRKIYGDGLICGFLRKQGKNEQETILYQIKKSDIFFGEILKSKVHSK